MITFEQWLAEKGLRTGLGPYPSLYATGQYPPLYFAPISATAALQLAKFHKGEHPETEDKPKKKGKKKNKKSKKKKD